KALSVAHIPQRPQRQLARFIVQAIEYSNEVVVQVYNPADSRTWCFPSTSNQLRDLHALIHTLRVVSVLPHGQYTVVPSSDVDQLLQSHVVVELQRHIRRKLAQQRVQDLAIHQWLRLQVKNRYQYVHGPSGLWRDASKPRMLRNATPVNAMREWYFVLNYTHTRVPYAHYIYPRRAAISRKSQVDAAMLIQTWLRNQGHNRRLFDCVRSMINLHQFHVRWQVQSQGPPTPHITRLLLYKAMWLHLFHADVAGAAPLYDDVARLFVWHDGVPPSEVALVLCVCAVFWLATCHDESSIGRRQLALTYLGKYRPQLDAADVASSTRGFHQ
ncbi:hypothetical protein H310_15010, partial [Aphanomyces invadans]